MQRILSKIGNLECLDCFIQKLQKNSHISFNYEEYHLFYKDGDAFDPIAQFLSILKSEGVITDYTIHSPDDDFIIDTTSHTIRSSYTTYGNNSYEIKGEVTKVELFRDILNRKKPPYATFAILRFLTPHLTPECRDELVSDLLIEDIASLSDPEVFITAIAYSSDENIRKMLQCFHNHIKDKNDYEEYITLLKEEWYILKENKLVKELSFDETTGQVFFGGEVIGTFAPKEQVYVLFAHLYKHIGNYVPHSEIVKLFPTKPNEDGISSINNKRWKSDDDLTSNSSFSRDIKGRFPEAIKQFISSPNNGYILHFTPINPEQKRKRL